MEYCEGKLIDSSWRFGLSHQKEEKVKWTFHRGRNYELVHLNSDDIGVHPWKKNSSLRH